MPGAQLALVGPVRLRARMTAVVSALGADGLLHVWNTSARGGSPLCGEDTFLHANASDPLMAQACWSCCNAIYDAIVKGTR